MFLCNFIFSREPTGCPEQTLSKWIPMVVATKYLKSLGKLTSQRRDEATKFLDEGYQKLLKTVQPDGSFQFWSYDMWSETTEVSVWLTAYITKVFGHANGIAKIDAKTMHNAREFLKRQQLSDGSFKDPNKFYPGGDQSQSGVPLTAFIIIALIEMKDFRKPVDKPCIDKALVYIGSKAISLDDNFALAISSYAFALEKHADTNSLINSTLKNALVHDEMMYWHRSSRSLKPYESVSSQIEIASYVILALVEQNRVQEALPILKWLMTKRNSLGGFKSTQDTVIGVQALAAIAPHFLTTNNQINIKMEYERGRQKTFALNSPGDKAMQRAVFEPDTRKISLKASGTGFAYVQLAYNYDEKLDSVGKGFTISASLLSTSNTPMVLKICSKFSDTEKPSSGMALIEVHLPSGFVYDPSTAERVKSAGVRVRR
jgi:CD109 antigen